MGTWTLTNNILTARDESAGFGYSSSAAVRTSGVQGDSWSTTLTSTEIYDGTSWSSGNDRTVTQSQPRGAGTAASGLVFGGWDGADNQTTTEEYDGTSFTTVNSMLVGARGHGGFGESQSAAVNFAGFRGAGGGSVDDDTENWNGTSWSSSGNFTANEASINGAGTQASAVTTGGQNFNTNSSTYNGSSWTAASNLIRSTYGSFIAGWSAGAAIAAGARQGEGNFGDTQEFNGISWIDENNPNEGRGWIHSEIGHHESALMAGGSATRTPWSGANTPRMTTEEWEDAPLCWNFTARYLNSSRLFKKSGPGTFPRVLRVPKNLDLSTGKMIDDGQEIDPDQYDVEEV